jgi:DNA-binding IclR family transcriptional regulator
MDTFRDDQGHRDDSDATSFGTTGAYVNPLGRALSVLSVFGPHERWMGLTEIALKSAVPLSTASRLLKSLLALGYVYYHPQQKKYRLTAKVLKLGYAAIAHSELQNLALPKMQDLADETQTQVVLGSRDRLDVVLIESCHCNDVSNDRRNLKFGISVGTRLAIAESPLGWALLAALPELERRYLSLKIETRDRLNWSRIRKRLTKAQVQIQDKGFCSSLGEIDPDIAAVAMPLTISGHAPLVLACIGSSARMSNSRMEREFGPRLKQIVRYLQEEVEYG